MRILRSGALATCLGLSAAASLAAQELTIGPKGGLNITRMTFEEAGIDHHINSREGFHIGAVGVLDFTDYLGLQMEIAYSQKGMAADEQTDYTFQGAMDMAFLDIPMLIRFGADGDVAPHLFAGPVLAIEVSCKLNDVQLHGDRNQHLTGLVNGDCDDADFDVQRETWDLGLRVGAGFDFPTTWGEAFIDGMYDFGLRDMNANPDMPGSIKGRGVCFSAGFRFPVANW